MEHSSTPTSLNMKKQSIIAGHLKELSEISWKKFKLALCKIKPSGKGEGIKMINLKDKSMDHIVELIFKCYTKRLGPGIIMKILTELKENEMRISVQRDLKEASKVLKDMKVHSMGSTGAIPNDDTVSSSEPPAKKIRQQDRDAPGQSQCIKKNVNKQGGPRQTQKQLQLKQGKSLKIQQSMNKNGGPRPAQKQPKQEMAALSELVRNPAGFFKEVEARLALYDLNHPQNCDKEVKKNLWKEVASKLIKDWEQLDSKDKEEIIIILPRKWRNFADSFQREYKKQVNESKSDPGPSERTKYRYYEQLLFLLPTVDRRQTTSNLDCKQDDAQQDSENHDERRPKKKQAAENKTEKSKQGLQTVSERFPQDNMSTEMDEDSFFLLSFLKKIGEIPSENRAQLKIEIINLFEKYSKPVVPHNDNAMTTPSHNSFFISVPMENNPACYSLPGSNLRIPSSSQSSPYMSSHYSV